MNSFLDKCGRIKFAGLIILTFFVRYAAQAQGTGLTFASSPADNLIPPSPEASALGRYAAIPVGLYTGTPQINIPLWEVTEGDITVPISLSYHASGHLVDDIAPRTGMGWTLNAGGVVTRTIIGEADEYLADGFLAVTKDYTRDQILYGSNAQKIEIWNYLLLCSDAEPDQFSFNFGGYTGKFAFEWNTNNAKKIAISSDRKISIEPIGLPEPADYGFIQGWKIYGEDGMVYWFEAVETTGLPVPINNAYPCYYTDRAGNRIDPTTSWYLTKIESPSGSWVVFEYEPYNLSFRHRMAETQYHKYGVDPTDKKVTWRRMSVNGQYLSRIRTSSGNTTVVFENNGFRRTDLPRHFDADYGAENVLYGLGSIKIFNKNQEVVRMYSLSYDNEINRLTLKSILEHSSNFTFSKPPYRFTYHATKLPAINPDARLHGFFAQDHWGYYNANWQNTLLPEYRVQVNGQMQVYDEGATRKPSPSRVMAGMLTSIQYPTGGTTTFEYEPNDYSFVGSVKKNRAIAGGVRIKKITDHDGISTANDIVRRFEYTMTHADSTVSSGILANEPFYTYDTYIYEVYEGQGSTIPARARMSSPVVALGTTQGSYVGYWQVTEFMGNNGEGGKRVSQFQTFSEFNNDFQRSTRAPFPLSVSYDFKRGLLKKQVDYKYDNGNYVPVRQRENEYTYQSSSVSGIKVGEACEGCLLVFNYFNMPGYSPEQIFHVGTHEFVLGIARLQQTVEKTFDITGTFQRVENFTYDPSLQFLKYHTVTKSDGKQRKTEYTRPFDFVNGYPEVTAVMRMRHMYSPVMETIVKEKYHDGTEKVVDATLNRYSLFNHKALPSAIMRFSATAPVTDFLPSRDLYAGNYDTAHYTLETQFDSYNSYGNPSQVTSRGGETVAYIWGTGGTDVIARIANGQLSQCAFTSFEGHRVEGNWTCSTDIPYPLSGFKSGQRSFTRGTVTSNVLPSGEYVVSLWAKGGGKVVVNGIERTTDATWKRYEWILPNTTSVTVVTNDNVIDDLRLHPRDARMKTFTYKSLVGVTSITDENHEEVFYEYDTLGRLVSVKDDEGNMLQHYKYNYKQN